MHLPFFLTNPNFSSSPWLSHLHVSYSNHPFFFPSPSRTAFRHAQSPSMFTVNLNSCPAISHLRPYCSKFALQSLSVSLLSLLSHYQSTNTTLVNSWSCFAVYVAKILSHCVIFLDVMCAVFSHLQF